MEAVGQLTGGVAHDFNNLLTVILGGLETIARQTPHLPESPATTRIVKAKDMALQGVQRAVTLTTRLLAFSRQQPLVPTAIDANKLVAGVCELLRRTLGESISLETVLAGGLWPTFADANQLENALLNLALNARDAMPNGGRMTIETANCYLDEAYVRSLAEPVTRGQYVMIAVADTGMGMDQSTLEKAFEPFFTTKEVGKGTGLGLSQVYGFVRQSSGHVKIYSEIDEGTTVKIYLPRHLGATEIGPSDDMPDAVRAIGKETILVAEDDEALRLYTTDILRELGYRVLEAGSGAQALEILDKNDEVDLLFSDVVMPGGINGPPARRRSDPPPAPTESPVHDRLYPQRNRPSRPARSGHSPDQQAVFLPGTGRQIARAAGFDRLSLLWMARAAFGRDRTECREKRVVFRYRRIRCRQQGLAVEDGIGAGDHAEDLRFAAQGRAPGRKPDLRARQHDAGRRDHPHEFDRIDGIAVPRAACRVRRRAH